MDELDHAQETLYKDYQATFLAAGTPENVLRTVAQRDEKSLKSSVTAIESFFKHYDDFNMAKIDFFMDKAMTDSRRKLTLSLKDLKSIKF